MMRTKNLVPMAFVANVARSIRFYSSLGFGVGNTFTPPGADAPAWAWLQSGGAQIMVAQASHPVVPDQQAVLFYIYTEDVAAAHPALRVLSR